MFKAVGKLTTKRPRVVIVSMVLFMIVAGAIGGGVVKSLTSGGFDDPAAPSVKAANRLSNDFGQKSSNVLLLVTAKTGTVDDPAVAASALKIEQNLRSMPYMQGVLSYWTAAKSPALRSSNGKQALIVGTLTGSEDQIAERIKNVTPQFTIDTSVLKVGVGGIAEINRQFSVQVEKDLKFAEIIALPITLIILLLVFRSVVAAMLPLLIGIFSIFGTLLVLFILTKFTSVSIYALNLTTMLGLGLAVDYSLFMVSRFREQLAHGDKVAAAVTRTVKSAGRTVLFSAFTVAVSLSALLVFKQPFLRSFAFAGVAVSLIAALGALILLPATLMLLGKRINAWPIGSKVSYEKGSRFWHRLATVVMRRPIVIGTAVIIVLLFLGGPFLSINLGRSDERSLPKTNPARLVHQDLRTNFTSQETSAIQLVSVNTTNVTPASIAQYAATVSRLSNVDHVEAATGLYIQGRQVAPPTTLNQYMPAKGTWLAVILTVDPSSAAAKNTVQTLRHNPSPFAFYVGGQTATTVDLKDSIIKQLPLALGLIAIATFILLFMMFGGVLVPIKALLINALSLSATFGAMVWVFQEGHLSSLLNFTPTGVIDTTMPILMFCVAFGLSMDYEVFLLSRIKEDYDKTGNNREAVAHGLEKTGGIVTAAALTISVVFLAFGTSGVTIIKMFGLVLALAVLLDAFIIRGTLVPAFMRLAGKANWWAPKPLKQVYDRYGISEID